MPRKKKETTEKKPNKKNLLNTMVKRVSKDEHIILKLPLTQNNIDKITKKPINHEYIPIPQPYSKNECFVDDMHNTISGFIQENNNNAIIDNYENSCPKRDQCCFWCCHQISYNIFGMPINYNSITDTYETYGSFCSLNCANAYNFSSHTGSDRVWEINSMIQMMGKRYGIDKKIRPAPSRYLLKMFNGYLGIDEFRSLHKNDDTCHILNLPPMISLQSAYEVVNTSYIKNHNN